MCTVSLDSQPQVNWQTWRRRLIASEGEIFREALVTLGSKYGQNHREKVVGHRTGQCDGDDTSAAEMCDFAVRHVLREFN